jgi:predicted flap endonuclease-1-like 5' DNA nuclease
MIVADVGRYLQRWIDLLFWWVPWTEETRLETAKESTPGASAQDASRVPEEVVEQQVPTAEEVVPDDLTVIKGIGPAVQGKLRSLGITTFRDLATANPDDVAEQLKGSQPVSKARVHGWIKAARERTEARD